jgi:hypothetical protein
MAAGISRRCEQLHKRSREYSVYSSTLQNVNAPRNRGYSKILELIMF